MAALREIVGGVTRDPVPTAEVLRRVRHAESVVRVDERDPEVVLELLLAERESPTGAADLVRRHAHVLGAAGKDELGLPELDLLRGEQDGLKSRTAETVDRQRRGLLPHAGCESDVPREVDRIARRPEQL